MNFSQENFLAPGLNNIIATHAGKLTPSPRQGAILEVVKTPYHLLVQACAGSGKTTTLALICSLIPPEVPAVALCFNKSIADEFEKRLPHHVQACTFHSLGFSAVKRAVRNVRVDDRKLRYVLDGFQPLQAIPEDLRKVLRSDLDAMVGLVTDMALDPTDPDMVREAIDQTGRAVEAFADSFPFLNGIMDAMDRWTDVITFGEMLRHPLVHGYRLFPYKAVLVDEAQDMNAVQHAMLARIVDPNGGKLIAVGDRNQSVYGFRGADPESMDRLKAEWGMIELPLDVSYRCPKAVVAEAQKIVGTTILPADSAPEGKVERRGLHALASTEGALKAGNMVLCRINAPLVPLAFRLLRRNVKVLLRGRDLGVGLQELIKKLNAGTITDLIQKAVKWKDKMVEHMRAADKSTTAIQGVEDKVETLISFAEESQTVAQVMARVDEMFSDQTPANVVLLSTVHKAKGLEADTVVLIRPDLLGAPPWAKTEEAQAQEKNIAYVAITRAKLHLVFQDSPIDKAKKPKPSFPDPVGTV